MNISQWAGHLLKIKISKSWQSCLTLKINGTIIYPFDLTVFKKAFEKVYTTRSSFTTQEKTHSVFHTASVTGKEMGLAFIQRV